MLFGASGGFLRRCRKRASLSPTPTYIFDRSCQILVSRFQVSRFHSCRFVQPIHLKCPVSFSSFQFPIARFTLSFLSFLVSRFLVLVSRPLELIEHRQSFRCFSHSSRSRRSGTLVTFGMSCLNKKVTFLLVWFRTRAIGVVPRLCFRPFSP